MSGLKGGWHPTPLFPCALLLSAMIPTLAGCGAGDSYIADNDEFFVADTIISTEDPFDRSQLMVVQIEMAPEDFTALQAEGRSLHSAISDCPDNSFDYSNFKGTVTINGESIHDVAIRKKGYAGSLSLARPSFKLDIAEYREGRHFQGLDRLTLNNNRQDPALLRQCIAYDVYQAAGLAVPRCNLASVSVNGRDMGIYTHVESIKKPFLQRAFGDDSGNLYEAQIAEFGTYLNERFELKSNQRENNRSDLSEVAELLISDDEQWLQKLNTLIDVDEFIQLWAADSVLGNWDSATGNTNNYYIYHNPQDDLFHFIPWGTDAAFTGDFILKPGIGPLYKTHAIARRLYNLPETRQRYENAVADLFAQSASATALVNKIDQFNSIVSAPESAITSLKTFILGDSNTTAWQDQLLMAIANGAAGQTDYINTDAEPECNTSSFDLTLEFGASDSRDHGSFKFNLDDDQSVNANIYYASFGSQGVDSISYSFNESTTPPTHGLTIIGVDINDSYQPYVLQLSLENDSAVAGSHPLHAFANSLMLFRVNDDKSISLIATAESGSLQIEKFEPESGEFEADFSIKMTTFQ